MNDVTKKTLAQSKTPPTKKSKAARLVSGKLKQRRQSPPTANKESQRLMSNACAFASAHEFTAGMIARDSGIHLKTCQKLLDGELLYMKQATVTKLTRWMEAEKALMEPVEPVTAEQEVSTVESRVGDTPPATAPEEPAVLDDVHALRSAINTMWNECPFGRDNRPSIGSFADEYRLLKWALRLKHMLDSTERELWDSATDSRERAERMEELTAQVRKKDKAILALKCALAELLDE